MIRLRSNQSNPRSNLDGRFTQSSMALGLARGRDRYDCSELFVLWATMRKSRKDRTGMRGCDYTGRVSFNEAARLFDGCCLLSWVLGDGEVCSAEIQGGPGTSWTTPWSRQWNPTLVALKSMPSFSNMPRANMIQSYHLIFHSWCRLKSTKTPVHLLANSLQEHEKSF